MPALDIKIDRTTDDIVVTNGLLETVTGTDAGAQRIYDKLHTFEGEWYLDLKFGIPYRADIMVKDAQLPIIGAIMKDEILDSADDGSTFTKFELIRDDATRLLTVNADVKFPDETDAVTVSQPVG